MEYMIKLYKAVLPEQNMAIVAEITIPQVKWTRKENYNTKCYWKQRR